MKTYDEFYIGTTTNNQFELIGSKDNWGYHIAVYEDLHYAELAAEFLNNMLEEGEE